MNTLAPEEVQKLRDAFDRGLGVRAAARETGLNRETCGRYFTTWWTAPQQSPVDDAPLVTIERPALTEYDAVFVSPDGWNHVRRLTFSAKNSDHAWAYAKSTEKPEIERLRKVVSGRFRK